MGNIDTYMMRNKNTILILVVVVQLIFTLPFINAIPQFNETGISFDVFEDSPDSFSLALDNYIIRDSFDSDDDEVTFALRKVRKNTDDHNSNNIYPWFRIDNSGILKITPSHDDQAGEYLASIFVGNKKSLGESRKFIYDVKKVNDPPDFKIVESRYQLADNIDFLEYITAEDEEEHYPLLFEITFLDNCNYSEESIRENCNLFVFEHVGDNSIKVEFTPTKDDIGTYYANISVRDSGENYECNEYCAEDYKQNRKTYYSKIVEFEVLSKAENIEKVLLSPVEDFQELNTQYDLLLSALIAIVIFIFIFNYWKYPIENFVHKIIDSFEEEIGIKKSKKDIKRNNMKLKSSRKKIKAHQ